MSWSESVDESLCFGWIDSTKVAIDQERFKQYFTKRNPKSNWSKVNKDKIAELVKDGRMTVEGFRSVEVAKENGCWSALDAVENLEIPEDLQRKLAEHPLATDYLEGLSKSTKKMILHWLFSAKRTTTREKRIKTIVESAAQGLKPPHLR